MPEKSEAQRVATEVGTVLVPRQDLFHRCRSEFEDLVKEYEARLGDQEEAVTKAREAVRSEWEAIDQGKKTALLTDGELQKPPKKGYRWFPRLMNIIKIPVCRDTGGWVPADVYETLEHGLEEPPWKKRDRPFAVRVMRLALLHDEALPEASHLLGPPENDSPPIALFRQGFRVHLSGVCKWGGVGEVFDHYYRPDHELCTWDDNVLHGLQDDLERVRAELAERPKEAFGKNGGPEVAAGPPQGKARRRNVRAPTDVQRHIAQFYENNNKTQIETGEVLTKYFLELRKQYPSRKDLPVIVSQSMVCRAVKAENRWRAAGTGPGLPQIPTRKRKVADTFDPDVINMGARTDHRARRLRARPRQRHKDK